MSWLLLALTAPVPAKTWCAEPLVVHEWGVQVFEGDAGHPVSLPLPAHVHRLPSPTLPVRDLPADSGIRALPVLHLYGAPGARVAVEVGFSQGDAAAWFPDVDARRRHAVATHPDALDARSRLEAAWSAHTPGEPLPPDPSAQLAWEALTLTTFPSGPVAEPSAWVEAVRSIPSLWVESGAERERFVFYEATTWEQPAVVAEPESPSGPCCGLTRLRNRSDWPVHDVRVLHRHDSVLHVAEVSRIDPGGTEIAWPEARTDAELVGLLAASLRERVPPGNASECVTQRDPAVPAHRSTGYGLTPDEAQVFTDLWLPEILPAEGEVAVVYREDPAALDTLMPLSVYTDAQTWVAELHRLGLVVWRRAPTVTPGP